MVFILAAHCVATSDAFGNVNKTSKLTIRVPLRPWKDFPEDKLKYKHGQKETNHLYKSVVVCKKQIFVHEE